MSAIERGLYVAVGAADLAVEKVRELPAVKIVVERTSKIRETSLIDQAREIEPKVRKQAEKLQARGETVVKRVRDEAKVRQEKIRELPAEARKQIQEFPENARKNANEFADNARKQANELRERVEKAIGRGDSKTAAKPAPKTSAAKATASSSTKS